MGITSHGQHFELRFEENVHLVPELVRQLAAEAAQDAAPAGDALPQSADLAVLVNLRRSA